MGAARRFCVRAVMLAGMFSAIVSGALPGCQFPDYAMGRGGSGGATTGGGPDQLGGTNGEGGDAGGQSGDSGDGGAGARDDGGQGGTEPATPCAVQDCVPKVPGWSGPFALWDDIAGALNPLPGCPEGYAKPNDLHHGVVTPTDGCKCTCGATGQVCSSSLTLYDDQKCEALPPCGTAPSSTLLACGPVTGCIHSQGSMKATAPAISGGTCKEDVTPPTPASWQYDSRLCSSSGASVCEDRSQVCAPLPSPPYSSKLCVTNVIPENQPVPDCPAGYQKGSKMLYGSFDDNRTCSACGCSGVTGGSCSGRLWISAEADCTGSTSEYKFADPAGGSGGGGCQPFAVAGNNAHPTSVGSQFDVTRGTCSVVTPSTTVGTAPTIGSTTLVCCQ